MHPSPPTTLDPRCVYCGEEIEGASWNVTGLLGHHPRPGQAHGGCVPWELEQPPYGHLVKELPKAEREMHDKIRKGRILAACISRMHKEWPLRARHRVAIIERLLEDYRGY